MQNGHVSYNGMVGQCLATSFLYFSNFFFFKILELAKIYEPHLDLGSKKIRETIEYSLIWPYIGQCHCINIKSIGFLEKNTFSLETYAEIFMGESQGVCNLFQ